MSVVREIMVIVTYESSYLSLKVMLRTIGGKSCLVHYISNPDSMNISFGTMAPRQSL